MSVLASKRSESKAQFVMIAYDIYKDGAGAVARLDRMADKLGELIAKEEMLLNGVIRSDASRTG